MDDAAWIGFRGVDVRALVDAGQEPIPPECRADDWFSRAEHDEAGQVLILAAETIQEP